MKKIFLLLIISIVFVNSGSLFAQDKENSPEDRWERFRAEKVAFLTNKLDLTPAEAQKFWPVYNALEKERSEVQSKRHELDRQVRGATEKLSDSEVIKLTREYVSNMEKEGTLGPKYNEEFLKILPPQKVLILYKSENEFRMYMFRKYRDNQRKQEDKE